MWKALSELVKGVAKAIKAGAKQVAKGTKELVVKKKIRGITRISDGIKKITNSPKELLRPIHNNIYEWKTKKLNKKLSSVLKNIDRIQSLANLDKEIVSFIKQYFPNKWRELNKEDDRKERQRELDFAEFERKEKEYLAQERERVFKETLKKLEEKDHPNNWTDKEWELDKEITTYNWNRSQELERDREARRIIRAYKREEQEKELNYKDFINYDWSYQMDVAKGYSAEYNYLHTLLSQLDRGDDFEKSKAKAIYEHLYKRGYVDKWGRLISVNRDFRNKKSLIFNEVNRFHKRKYGSKLELSWDVNMVNERFGGLDRYLNYRDYKTGEYKKFSTLSDQEQHDFFNEIIQYHNFNRSSKDINSEWLEAIFEIYRDFEAEGFSRGRVKNWAKEKMHELERKMRAKKRNANRIKRLLKLPKDELELWKEIKKWNMDHDGWTFDPDEE